MSVDQCRVGWCATGGLCFCCLSTKTSIIILSIISLFATVADALWTDPCECYTSLRAHVETLRLVLRALFQVANLLLIIASVIENPSLIQIYVWYTLAFIVMGFAVSIVDTLLRLKSGSRFWIVANFLTEVTFLFVLSRCLPLVDMYRKELGHSSTSEEMPPEKEF